MIYNQQRQFSGSYLELHFSAATYISVVLITNIPYAYNVDLKISS